MRGTTDTSPASSELVAWAKSIGVEQTSKHMGVSALTASRWIDGSANPSRQSVKTFVNQMIPALTATPPEEKPMANPNPAPTRAPQQKLLPPQRAIAPAPRQQPPQIHPEANQLKLQTQPLRQQPQGQVVPIKTPSEATMDLNMQRVMQGRATSGMSTHFTPSMQETEAEPPMNMPSMLPNSLSPGPAITQVPTEKHTIIPAIAPTAQPSPGYPQQTSTIQPIPVPQQHQTLPMSQPNGVMTESQYQQLRTQHQRIESTQVRNRPPTQSPAQPESLKKIPYIKTGNPWLAICPPIYKGGNPLTMQVYGHLRAKYGEDCLDMDGFGDAMIENNRNRLAEKFLQSSCEWSIWFDDDMFPPIGHSEWFRERAYLDRQGVRENYSHLDFVDRLLSHNVTLVSALYVGRKPDGPPMFGELNQERFELARRGSDQLLPVDWIGTGCFLAHRSVFEDIEKTHPMLSPCFGEERQTIDDLTGEVVLEPHYYKEFQFFSKKCGRGEDVVFSRRAFNSGHQPYVDLGLAALHIGFCCYGVHNTPAAKLTPII